MPTKRGGKKNIREQFINEQLTKEKKLSIWLWIGVIGLCVLIIFFWGYSLWSNVSSINWKKTEESKILKQSSSDWDQVLQTTRENELQNQLTKLQLKELLNNVLKQQLKNISTSTTSTTDISTSTISTITTSTIISTTTKTTSSKR